MVLAEWMKFLEGFTVGGAAELFPWPPTPLSSSTTSTSVATVTVKAPSALCGVAAGTYEVSASMCVSEWVRACVHVYGNQEKCLFVREVQKDERFSVCKCT